MMAIMYGLSHTSLASSGIDYNLVNHTNAPRLSVNLIFSVVAGAAIYILLRRRLPKGDRALWVSAIITAVSLQFFITNQQIVSGLEVHPMGLQQDIGTFLSAFLLVLLLNELHLTSLAAKKMWLYNAFLVIISVWIIVSMLYWVFAVAQRFLSFAPAASQSVQSEIRVVNSDLTKVEFDRIRKDPLHAIILNEQLASRLPLAAPRMLAPLFAYQYHFPWFPPICPEAVSAIQGATAHIMEEGKESFSNDVDYVEYKKKADSLNESFKGLSLSARNCSEEFDDKKPFHIITAGSEMNVEIKLN
jgi:hypothetical protein